MLDAQRLELRRLELSQQINEFPDDGDTAALEAMMTDLSGVSTRHRAAVLAATVEASIAPVEETAETRAISRLVNRASLIDYVRETTDGLTLTGASAELRSAVFGANSDSHRGFVPLELFLPVENRVDSITDVSTPIQDNQQPIAARVFNQSAMSFLGVATPTVPVGAVSYPRLTAGTTADVRSPGVELDGAAATLTNVNLTGIRLTASYTFGLESLANIMGFEEALREDVRGTISEKWDSMAINGQAAVANVSPAVSGVINELTAPGDPTAEADWSSYLAAYDAAVDGKYAVSSDAVRLLVGAATYKHAFGQGVGTQAAGGLLRDRLPSGRFRVSAAMPGVASKFQSAISYAAGAPGRGFISPVWNGIQLIDDQISQAKAGRRILTAVAIVGFDMIDPAPYAIRRFQVEA